MTRTLLQCSEKSCKRYSRGVNFGPLIGGNLVHVVNFFLNSDFLKLEIKSIFREISKFYFREVGQGTDTKFFSLTGLGRPRIMNAKIWPRPLRIWRKWGSNFLGVEQFQLPGGKIVGVVGVQNKTTTEPLGLTVWSQEPRKKSVSFEILASEKILGAL